MSLSCPRCQARVLWVVLPSGKRMPVDDVVDPAGTVAVMRDGRGTHVGRVVTRELPVLPIERAHVTHFATCTPTIAHRDVVSAHHRAVADGSVIELSRRRR